MNRREMFIAASAAIAMPAYAQIDPATTLAIAKAAADVYKKISEIKTENETAANFIAIRAKLDEISRKLDHVIDLLQALPDVFQTLLLDNERTNIVQQITAKSVSIVTQAENVSTRRRIPTSAYTNLLNSAIEQGELRERIAANYGPGVYPYVALSFMSEALAFRALRRENTLFLLQKTHALEQIRFSAEQFSRLANTHAAIAQNARETWANHIKLTKLGESFLRNYDQYMNMTIVKIILASYVDGNYEAGVTQQRYLVYDATPENIALPVSPFIDFAVPSTEKARHDKIFETLRSASETGRASDRVQPQLAENAKAAETLLLAITNLTY